MSDPKVKHIEMVCPKQDCKHRAFVQVVLVGDEHKQKKVDARANEKLAGALIKAHEDGEHDGR